MKRNPRKVCCLASLSLSPAVLTVHLQLKWTKAFRKAAGKEMVVDSTLTFAARRNVPVRYDRNLMSTTLKAMDRVAEIRAKREKVFYKERMAGNKQRQRDADRKLVAENEHLLPRQRASERMLDEARDAGVEIMEGVKTNKIIGKKQEKVKQKLLVEGGVDTMDID